MKLRLVLMGAMTLALTGCEKFGASNSDAAGAGSGASDIAADAASPDDPPVPEHNYTDKIGDVYYYQESLSSNDTNNGQAAAHLQGFKYLGKKDTGEVMIVGVNSRGFPLMAAICAVPCRVVKIGNGETYAFDRQSIIGAAIEDAINGQLIKTTLYEPEKLPPIHYSQSLPLDKPTPEARYTPYSHNPGTQPDADEQDGANGQ
ncbi:MAG TPA: hypothetical protein VFF98_17260 [Novosphingobium sp.]|nr:hypothetical protein [Novosphingobium sp.]